MYKANINYSILKERLDVLVKQGLLEERTVGKRRVVYAITERGRSLCALKQLKKILWNIRPLLKLSCYWAREIKMARDPKRLG